jgi:putative Mg2+ transporter-C (MgtC) family protein
MGFESEFVWRLVIAALLGGILGVERSLAGKHAGMRTYALVSMGSALFTIAGIAASYQFALFPGVNPLHLAGFVIVGIGFIGSGLAGFGNDHPAELTTASGIWVVSGIGVSAGMGYAALALTATVLSVLIFSVFARVERNIRIRFASVYNKPE